MNIYYFNGLKIEMLDVQLIDFFTHEIVLYIISHYFHIYIKRINSFHNMF